MKAVDPQVERLVRTGYEAFNRRDIDAALAVMAPDVRWANGWEGGHVEGHEAVRAYWTRQWEELDPTVVPTAVELDDEADGILVTVDQQVKDGAGRLINAGTVRHRLTISDGLVTRMDILED